MAVRDTTLKIIAEHLGLNASDISDDSTFDADLGVDSLDQIEIVIALEEIFEVTIEDADADQADTVGKLIALVDRLVAGR